VINIAKGKTEAQHQAERRARGNPQPPPASRRPGRRTGLSAKDIERTQEALRELEETKGDFAKDR
jgi:hypothetical protein